MGRRRLSSWEEHPRSYRLHFFYEPLGRYFRSSKRRLYWSFGFTNLDAVRQGGKGNECRGVEHEVELIWSLKSGKKRVYWNRRNISNLYQQQNPQSAESSVVNLTWQTPHGQLLQVVAHADAVPGVPQYDLLVDGVSFFRMPNVVELGQITSVVDSSKHSEPARREKQCDDSTSSISMDDSEESDFTAVHDRGTGEPDGSNNGSELDSFQNLADHHHPVDGMGFRLSMAGLSSRLEGEDELHSEVYSPMLESLRHRIVEVLPQTEEMVSRSIMQTFFPDYVSHHSEDILSAVSGSTEEKDPQQIEVDALFGAYVWAGSVRANAFTASLPRPPAVEARRNTWSGPSAGGDEHDSDHMQKLVDSIFIKVRNEDISSDEGARILLGAAAVLGLDFAGALPRDTVLFDNLNPDVTPEDLRMGLAQYGDLEAVAMSSGCRQFGFCRFLQESGFRRLMEADESRTFQILENSPRVIPLTENMHSTGAEREREPCERRGSPEPNSSLCASPTTVPHLMGAWTADDFDGSQELVVTPENHGVGLRKSVQASPRSAMTDLEHLVRSEGAYSYL